MAKTKRRRFSGAEKVAILKRHFVDREEISAICEAEKIHPTMFYEWQKRFFEHGARAFDADERQSEAQVREKLEMLEAKLQKKDGVIAELMEAHLTLKKTLGED